MKTTADYIVSGFAKIDSDLNYLMGCLKEVLLELGETKAAEFLPWQEGGQTHDINEPPPRIEQAYSIAFQLLNMVEENASTRTRHLREIEHGLADEPGLWGQQLAQAEGRRGHRGRDPPDPPRGARRIRADRSSHRGQTGSGP